MRLFKRGLIWLCPKLGQWYIYKSFQSLPSFYSWRCSQSFLLWQLWVVIRLEATCSCSGWIQGNQNNTWRNHNFHLGVLSHLYCVCVCVWQRTVWLYPSWCVIGETFQPIRPWGVPSPPLVIAINLPTPSWSSFPFLKIDGAFMTPKDHSF